MQSHNMLEKYQHVLDIYASNNEWSKCFNLANTLVESIPKSEISRYFAAGTGIGAKRANLDNFAITYYFRAVAYANLGGEENLTHAIEDYTQAISLSKETFYTAIYERGILYQKKGLYQQANQDLDLILKHDPFHAKALIAKAFIAKEALLDKQVAIDRWTKVTHHIQSPLAHLNLAALHLELKQPDIATKNFDQVTRLMPSDAASHLLFCGSAYLSSSGSITNDMIQHAIDAVLLDNIDDSHPSWLQTTFARPENDILLYKNILATKPNELTQATCYFALNDFENAQKHIEKAIENANDEWSKLAAHTLSIMIQIKTDKYVDLPAIEITSSDTDSARMTHYRALYHDRCALKYFSQQNNEKAVEMWDKAIALNPQHAMFYIRRSDAHHKMGIDTRAAEDAAMAEALRPKDPITVEHVATLPLSTQKEKASIPTPASLDALTASYITNSATPLSRAIMNNDTALVDKLITNGNLDEQDAYSRTALHYAAITANAAIYSKLVTAGASVSITDLFDNIPYDYISIRSTIQPTTELTPLSASIMEQSDQPIAELIETTLNLNQQDELGRTALHYAAIKKDFATIDLLIEAGASLAITDKMNKTPLIYLSQHDQPIKDSITQLSAVMLAPAQNEAEKLIKKTTIQQLINLQSNINRTDCFGRTAMHYAAMMGDANIAQLLLNAGAKINVYDNDNQRPVDYALKYNHQNLATELRRLQKDSTEATPVKTEKANSNQLNKSWDSVLPLLNNNDIFLRTTTSEKTETKDTVPASQVIDFDLISKPPTEDMLAAAKILSPILQQLDHDLTTNDLRKKIQLDIQPDLLKRALTLDNNLIDLGSSYLDLAISTYLIDRFPNENAEQLSIRKKLYISDSGLFSRAKAKKLTDILGSIDVTPTALSNCVRAIIAAAYLSGQDVMAKAAMAWFTLPSDTTLSAQILAGASKDADGPLPPAPKSTTTPEHENDRYVSNRRSKYLIQMERLKGARLTLISEIREIRKSLENNSRERMTLRTRHDKNIAQIKELYATLKNIRATQYEAKTPDKTEKEDILENCLNNLINTPLQNNVNSEIEMQSNMSRLRMASALNLKRLDDEIYDIDNTIISTHSLQHDALLRTKQARHQEQMLEQKFIPMLNILEKYLKNSNEGITLLSNLKRLEEEVQYVDRLREKYERKDLAIAHQQKPLSSLQGSLTSNGVSSFSIIKAHRHPDQKYMDLIHHISLIEERLGYQFKNKMLLIQALTHGSFVYAEGPTNNSLSDLGQSAHQFAITRSIHEKFPHANADQLTEEKNKFLSNLMLGEACVRGNVQEYLLHYSPAITHAVGDFIKDYEDYQERYQDACFLEDFIQENPDADKQMIEQAVQSYLNFHKQWNSGVNLPSSRLKAGSKSSRKEQYDRVMASRTGRSDWTEEPPEPPKILADTFHAMLGAIFLDSNHDINCVCSVINKLATTPLYPVEQISQDVDTYPESDDEDDQNIHQPIATLEHKDDSFVSVAANRDTLFGVQKLILAPDGATKEDTREYKDKAPTPTS